MILKSDSGHSFFSGWVTPEQATAIIEVCKDLKPDGKEEKLPVVKPVTETPPTP